MDTIKRKFCRSSALLTARTGLGWPRWFLARLINKQPEWVRDVEQGRVPVSREDAARLAAALKVSVEKLFVVEEKK